MASESRSHVWRVVVVIASVCGAKALREGPNPDTVDGERIDVATPPGWTRVETKGPDLLYQANDAASAVRSHPFLAEQWIAKELAVNSDFEEAFNDASLWHFAMMNDFPRNEMYKKALNKVVTENSVVLDIGSGSGLLAMIAAREGAKKVYTCEVNQVMSSIASVIVEQNGFADQIKSLDKISYDLTVGSGQDMEERADVLVSEIFSTYLTSEGVVAAVRHARQHLLTPGATIIPARGKLIAAVMESDYLFGDLFVDSWDGLDLSYFNQLRQVDHPRLFTLPLVPYRYLSNKVVVMDIDFHGELAEFDVYLQHFKVPVTANGTAHMVCMWFEMELDREGEFIISTDPDRPMSDAKQAYHRDHAWGQGCHSVNARDPKTLEESFQVSEGEELLLTVQHVGQDSKYPTPLFNLQKLPSWVEKAAQEEAQGSEQAQGHDEL